MKKTTLLAGVALLAAIPLDAMAGPDWRYVEGGYTQLEAEGNSQFDPDGVVISGTYLTTPNVYVTGDYRMTEEGRYDLDMLTLGAGYRLPLNEVTDVYFGANFEHLDTPGNDEQGFSLNAGARMMLTRQLEIAGEVGYYDVDEGEATVKIGANYHVNSQWAVGASYEAIDELDIMSLTARYNF